ncbi:stage II sporulation protein R [Intestinibacter sp.]|uniref:stage II sporulation protein R n=1 Tax=Intestinibacter sp. TaxID=1965304 RepID=UPI003F13AE3B
MKRRFIKREFKINTKIKIRIVVSVLMLIFTVGLMATSIYGEVSKIDMASVNYKDKLIRFHVLANSDSEEDQQLKLKVRDAVIDYLQPKLQNSKSISESERIIINEEDNLINICKDIIQENGYNYDVNIELGYSKFPTKQYSSVVLPAGEYKALRILIGKGQGKNWWCVMFPPLCFVDKQNNVIDKETDAKLREVLTEEEYELIVEKDNDKVDDLTIKFKIVEIIQKIKESYIWTGVIN